MPSPPAIEPHEAIALLVDRLTPVGVESVTPARAAGRVLAEPLRLDRDSPACDVSAMDGFAVRHADLTGGPLPVRGECRIGQAPAELPVGAALRIYTGSPLPRGADTVVRLEWVEERDGTIALNPGVDCRPGDDIRRRGENARLGEVVLEAGAEMTAAAVGAMATIGPASVGVRRPLRVAIVTTGSELEPEGAAAPPPWRLRDSNGPALAAMLSNLGWIGAVTRSHADDSLEATTDSIARGLAAADAVVLTGGVSKGAYDYVPDAVRAAGGEVAFHRLRARPGQPTLGAVAEGKPILGLPGNPLAVLTAGRRLLVPVLRRLGGFAGCDPPAPLVTLEAWSGRSIPLVWWRPVTLVGPGVARLALLRGSGDVCGPAATDGFVEVPPGCDTTGPYPYYPWRA